MEAKGCGGEPWGLLATDVSDPPKCIQGCRSRFLNILVGEHETLATACEVLSDMGHTGKTQPFRDLYCCDSQLCGVDNLLKEGKDPNVNWIITSCQNLGYYAIVDPGPPPATYTCTHNSVYGYDPRCQIERVILSSSSHVSEASTTVTKLQSSSSTRETDTSFATSRASIITPLPSRSSHTSTETTPISPSLAASSNASAIRDHNASPDGVSTGIKVTIALTTVVGLIIITTIAFCFLRAKKHRSGRRYNGFFRKKGNASTIAESPEPLVSSSTHPKTSNEIPLTPPPRLGERKLLPLKMQSPTGEAPRPREENAFPVSPMCSPVAARLVPRLEKSPKRPYVQKPGREKQITVEHVSSWTKREGSVASLVSSQHTTGSTGSATLTPSNLSDITIPSAPQQARISQMPPDIPGLVSPGPPPNRALPSTPSIGPTSPKKPARREDIGVAISNELRFPAPAATLTLESRDLVDLTQEYAREQRDSWGSWCGTGGGGPGVAVVSPKTAKNMQSPVLKEGDLERLGGRYRGLSSG